MPVKVPRGYIPSELSAVLKCRGIDLCHVCAEENKQDGRLKDRLMLRGLMTKLRGNSDSRPLCGGGLSGGMPGIVYYEFAVLRRDRRRGATANVDGEKINEETMTGRKEMPMPSGWARVCRI